MILRETVLISALICLTAFSSPPLLPTLIYGAQKSGTPKPNQKLEIIDISKGTGAEVKPGNWILIRFTATLLNGTQVLSSGSRYEAIGFELGKDWKIPGLEKGMIGMREGGERKITIPPEESFSKEELPPEIPPNSTLVINVELFQTTAAGSQGGLENGPFCHLLWMKDNPNPETRQGSSKLGLKSGAFKVKTVDSSFFSNPYMEVKPFEVAESGRLQVLNTGKESFQIYIDCRATPYCEGISAPLTPGQSTMIPISKGKYGIRVGEITEAEFRTCPPLPFIFELALLPAEQTLTSLLDNSPQQGIELREIKDKKIIRAALTKLNPSPSFTAKLNKPGLITVELTKESIDKKASVSVRGGSPETTTFSEVRHFWGPTDLTFCINLPQKENEPIDRLDEVSFAYRIQRFEQFQSARAFEVVPSKSQVVARKQLTAKLALKNTSPLNFKKIRLIAEFASIEDGIGAPMKRIFDKTFSDWKANEEKFIDFGLLEKRMPGLRKYELVVRAIEYELEEGPVEIRDPLLLENRIDLIELALGKSPKIDFAIQQANKSEHADYQSQIKLPVYENCSAKYPYWNASNRQSELREAFDECGAKLLVIRSLCSETHDVTTLPFVDCVRETIRQTAPELLEKRP